jgi:hypothetical protein
MVVPAQAGTHFSVASDLSNIGNIVLLMERSVPRGDGPQLFPG